MFIRNSYIVSHLKIRIFRFIIIIITIITIRPFMYIKYAIKCVIGSLNSKIRVYIETFSSWEVIFTLQHKPSTSVQIQSCMHRVGQFHQLVMSIMIHRAGRSMTSYVYPGSRFALAFSESLNEFVHSRNQSCLSSFRDIKRALFNFFDIFSSFCFCLSVFKFTLLLLFQKFNKCNY